MTRQALDRTVSERRATRDLQRAVSALTARAQEIIGSSDLIEAARRVRAVEVDVVTFAVLVKRAQGCTWAEIAEALSLPETFTRDHYAPIEAQWSRGEGVGPVLSVGE